MICILTFDENKEVVGWIIGPDIHEMRRAADAIGESELAAALYREEFPRPGKHELPTGHLMLVS